MTSLYVWPYTGLSPASLISWDFTGHSCNVAMFLLFWDNGLGSRERLYAKSIEPFTVWNFSIGHAM